MRGIGIDIVEIDRMKKRCEKAEFLSLAFTQAERTYCFAKSHSAEHFAARFAAKEAYMKAVGLGWTNQSDFKSIEVLHNANGQPYLQLHGETKQYFDAQKYNNALLTLSHTNQTAVAVVVLT